MMESAPGLLPKVWTPNHALDDSELEWLLCLASSFQGHQRILVEVGHRSERFPLGLGSRGSRAASGA
jgi:hypothetical protein